MQIVIFLLILGHFGSVYSKCTELMSCGDCISYAEKRCVWCAQNTMKNSSQPNKEARCRQKTEVYKDDTLDTEWCPANEVFDPDTKTFTIEDRPFSTEKGKVVQFHPQKINITLRPGIPAPIDMYFKQAKDFPLDMYFLMDNSLTMRAYSEKLVTQTLKIYEELTLMTNNVRLGIGSFVEKPALPYADTRFSSLQRTYVFENHVSLTSNMELLQKADFYKVNNSNYDSPEATLDGLMQVMVCDDKIGWRKKDEQQSRRIIILATEATFHSVGDGKMVGAYKPNDMTCHLDDGKRYNEKASLTYDYPSVSQIRYVAKENNFRLVFAVLKKVKDNYDDLAAEMFAADTVDLSNTDQIIPIIKEAYRTASREFKLQLKNVPKSIKVKTNCDDARNCKITQEKQDLHIKAEITALDCNKHSHFEISPFGMSNDKLSVSVTVDCTCPCEGLSTSKSSECSSAGVKECGVCKCDSNRSGVKCETECSSKDRLKLMDKCKKDPNDINRCSKNGDCVCGKCICQKDFSGDYCQFNDANCRKECPSDKGDCVLGDCVCKDYSKWSGPKCSCIVSDAKCIGPFSKEVCSGRGKCVCGRCECNSISSTRFFGSYCESCMNCSTELCEKLKEYATCIYEKNNKTDCDDRYTHLSVNEVKIMDKESFESQSKATSCRKTLTNSNIIVYKYTVIAASETEPAKLDLMVQDELDTPPVANIWIAIGSVVGGFLLVGLLSLIIWKIATHIYDRRAYDKFCKEATTAGFDITNPVYKDPTVHFVNVAYQDGNYQSKET